METPDYITPIDQFVIDFIRELRNRKKLSQQEIGSIIGVSREYIKDIENPSRRAKYNIRHINALAEYFEMSPKDFLPEKALSRFYKPSTKSRNKVDLPNKNTKRKVDKKIK